MKPALLALVILFAPAVALARFDASVDATTLSEADTLRLTLRADGTNLTVESRLRSAREGVRHSERRSAARRSKAINGQVEAQTTWTLLLKPKHTGALRIPAISLGGETTRPIDIVVKELDPQLRRAIAQTVFFETSYTPKQVYVQSQVVVTRRLFYVNGAQLYGDMPTAPEVPGAMVKLLGESEHSTAARDGRQYGMIEQRFAIFPERSGDLTIPPATVTGSVRLPDTGRRIGVDVSSDTLKITVLPIPAEYPRDAPWLPANDVELLEDWPGEPERGLSAGIPSQRTLIVRADGNASSAIPPLAMTLPDSLKAYPEPAKLSETQTRAGIVGTRTESTSLVATQPGDVYVARSPRDVVGHGQPTGSHGRATGAYDQDHRHRDCCTASGGGSEPHARAAPFSCGCGNATRDRAAAAVVDRQHVVGARVHLGVARLGGHGIAHSLSQSARHEPAGCAAPPKAKRAPPSVVRATAGIRNGFALHSIAG